MTSALVVTNGACRPCASASRLSTNTMARPPRMPMMVPSTACSASTASTCPHDPSPADRYSTRRTVSRTANGSLLPDSTSSVAPTRGRRRKPRAWTRKNTAAASVEATTAPTSNDSLQLMSSRYLATGAVNPAVIMTPTVASVAAGASTLRKVASRVRKPPSNRISASAIEPTR